MLYPTEPYQHKNQSFELLFEKHYDALVRYCFTIVRDVESARDIVQQSFISFWQTKGQEPQILPATARAYLYKTVYRAGLDALKHEQVKNKHANWVNHTAVELVEHRYSDHELEKSIQNAIDELPEQCRRIFLMSKVDGMKYRDIARELSLSPKTIENQMGKALKLLRGSLRHYLPVLSLLINLFSR